MVSFKEYLETCRFSGSPEADFVVDAQSDGDLSNARSWPELRSHMSTRRGVSPRSLEAAEVVWRAYEQSQGGR
jgi:hypothetical protein